MFIIGGGGGRQEGLEPERGGSLIKFTSHLSLKANLGEGRPNFKFHPINFKNVISCFLDL